MTRVRTVRDPTMRSTEHISPITLADRTVFKRYRCRNYSGLPDYSVQINIYLSCDQCECCWNGDDHVSAWIVVVFTSPYGRQSNSLSEGAMQTLRSLESVLSSPFVFPGLRGADRHLDAGPVNVTPMSQGYARRGFKAHAGIRSGIRWQVVASWRGRTCLA